MVSSPIAFAQYTSRYGSFEIPLDEAGLSGDLLFATVSVTVPTSDTTWGYANLGKAVMTVSTGKYDSTVSAAAQVSGTSPVILGGDSLWTYGTNNEIVLSDVLTNYVSAESLSYPMVTTTNTVSASYEQSVGTGTALYYNGIANLNGTKSNILDYLTYDNTLVSGYADKAYTNVIPVINDVISNYEEVTFTFNTAAQAVNTNSLSLKYGSYDSSKGDSQYTSFGQHLYNYYNGEGTTYTYGYGNGTYDWTGYNLFSGALIVNGQLSMSLNDTNAFVVDATSLSFLYSDALEGAAVNAYAQYLSKLQLATSSTWYWDSLDIVGANTEAEDAGTDAGVEADDDVIDEDGDDEDVVEDDVVEDEDEDVDVEEDFDADVDADEDEDVDVDVDTDDEDVDVDVDVDTDTDADAADTTDTTDTTASNPATGNAPIALAVIPVALAAAAVVAKKRG
jgi:hypothetical protein